MAPRTVAGGSSPVYNSTWGCVQHLLRTEGLRGLTRGMGATMARETPGNALFFTVYEVLFKFSTLICTVKITSRITAETIIC